MAASVGGGSVSAQARVMAPPEPQAQGDAVPTLNSFADVLNLIKLKRDIVLQLDVERYVRPISFRQGALEYEPVPGAPNNLAQRLVARLKEWTGQPWLIAARGGGGGGVAAGMGGGAVGAQARVLAAPEPVVQSDAVPTLNSFADVLNLIKLKRDIVLQLDVERYVRPISFRQGALEYEPVSGAPNNLAQRLVARLKEWTGQPWLIAARGGGGAESAWERQKREALEVRAEVEADPFVVSVMQAFPGAEILSIRNIPLPEAVAAADLPDDEDDDA